MARAIIRYSFEGGTQTAKKTRGKIREELRAAGFAHIGTASWEKHGARGELVEALTTVLEAAARPEAGALDHLWLYLDDPDGPAGSGK
jgi:hypothetical protein